MKSVNRRIIQTHNKFDSEIICLTNHLQHRRPHFNPWVGKLPWRRAWQPTPVGLPRKSPRTEEPGGLQSMELQKVRHDWVTKHSTTTNYKLFGSKRKLWYGTLFGESVKWTDTRNSKLPPKRVLGVNNMVGRGSWS